ncbi:MAG: hypothetical protein CV088_22045 [Nitrospira sp. LK70]|nr:hypothetical protein [Nitrospira sp. LK70]
MLRNAISLGLVHRNFTIAIAQVIVLGLITLPLAGCSADGQGGSPISSLSTPSDAQSGEGTQSGSNPATTGSPAEDDPTATSTEPAAAQMAAEDTTAEQVTAHATEDSDPSAGAKPIEGEEDPTISVTSTPTGATARLTWDASADPNVQGYFVHYGKKSSGEHGSCSYEESQRVGAPPATITDLEPNTVYFFSISAFGESESESDSPCSNEVLVVTPSVQS